MPVPYTPQWRIDIEVDPATIRELIRALNEIGSAHGAELRAQEARDRSHIEHVLAMQESRIRAHVSDQVHRLTKRLNEQERRWLNTLMWACITVPVIVAFIVDALRSGR